MATGKIVTNGGSAIGEAIGHFMEEEVQKCISDFLTDYQCHFLKQTGYNPITRKTSKKLLLYDDFGNDYNVDGIITNEHMQPLVLLESKYIRYKKHNRDKGSWICNAHSAIRRRYPSIRASVAVLAGNWSKTSLTMIESHDVNVFLIDFSYITNILRSKGINFEWEENDRKAALEAWNKYDALTENDKTDIAIQMVSSIKNNLFAVLANVLDDTKPREVKRVVLEIHTNKGEINKIAFNSINEAKKYLESFSVNNMFNSASFITIFDIPTLEE